MDAPLWQGGPCWWQKTVQSGQNQFRISKPESKPTHFCGPSKTAQCRFYVKWIKTHLRANRSRTLERMEKEVVMWHSLWHVPKLGCVCIKLHRYYFLHSRCVLHQLKDILGKAGGSQVCIQTRGPCTLWGCASHGARGGPRVVLLAGVAEGAEKHQP